MNIKIHLASVQRQIGEGGHSIYSSGIFCQINEILGGDFYKNYMAFIGLRNFIKNMSRKKMYIKKKPSMQK